MWTMQIEGDRTPGRPDSVPGRRRVSAPVAGLAGVIVSLVALTAPVAAQESEEDEIEEVIVQGTRQVIQDAIAIKRNSVEITDGLSAADIGDLPALSIGEALETITGAASHRENGGATEISIRGLGPFLGATTFNGRDATNGSGDRSVNFSQFPSELMSRLMIHKTQNASLIEGGVSGVIELETLKPLQFGRQRIQFDVKGNANPIQRNINDSTQGDLGHRATFSYVDQFEIDGGSEIGVAFGYQDSAISQPEAEVRSSSPTGSSRWACLNDPRDTTEGYYATRTDDCEDSPAGSSSNGAYDTSIDPATGRAVHDGYAYAWAPSSRGYRQNDTQDTREAVFAAVQFRPSDHVDIGLDLQLSERVQAERRHDLNFANQRRNTVGVTADALVTSPSGAVFAWEGDTAIESNSELYSRAEDYSGGGLSVDWVVSDRLTVSADASISETVRIEKQITLRTQSDNDDIFNEDTAAGYRPRVAWDRRPSGIHQYVIEDFDVTDHTLFSDEYRVRVDSDVDRTNTIAALRGDFELDLELAAINSVEGGFRIADQEYVNLGGTRYTTPNLDDSSQGERDAIVAINQTCRNTEFPESGFLETEADGPLVTVVDSDTGATIYAGNAWATFDTQCMVDEIFAYHGVDFAYPDQTREHPNTTDVTESTTAAYAMANFAGNWGNRPFQGNFGVRIVNTSIEAVAWRTEYEIVEDGGFLSMRLVDGAPYERVVAEDDYTEVLPSLNVVMDLNDEVLLRGGVFRGLSRADMSDLGYNRSFTLNSSDDITDVDELISGVSGSGNPYTRALPSWNFDTALEWYPNDDSILAGGLYLKQFTGGFEQIRSTETFLVDGQPVRADFTAAQSMEDTATLVGLEVTAAHRFGNGFGFKLSFNLADSDFEFEDSNYGSVVVRNDDGSILSETAGILPPGNVPGFSEQTLSAQLYYQFRGLDIQAVYKHRSDYFQPYTSNGTRLRFIGDVGVWEGRVSYRFLDHYRVSLEAINIFDEPKTQYFYVRDELGEVNSYGPRVFVSFRGRF
ncbi:MAG: TonB-dependent receptor [Gammaproteobacteria bacterium]|nr:TonB-dependent receptor [Gammaproteobacteria bacterium]MYF27751.1 TonB-dependent receptor [Gammaproteobacteria bacterium]MYK45620.1 TonB-dependent receptor [Gammaproteobacteria bacterium]